MLKCSSDGHVHVSSKHACMTVRRKRMIIMLNQHLRFTARKNPILPATETNAKNAKHSAIHISTILWLLNITVRH